MRYFLFIFLLIASNSFAQPGCTDYHATNFDPSALINDGSCVYAVTPLPLAFKCVIDSFALNETSGIVNQDNNFWTHDDDTQNSIFKIDTLSTSVFQQVTINNAVNHDWEDITSDSNYIYVGDVGNNAGNRTNLRFYKVSKADITPTTTSVDAGIIRFSYSDQVDFTVNPNNHFYDCEAFFVLHDTIHLFTKGWVNKWSKHYVLTADTGTHVAQLVDSFFVNGFTTSAAIQGDSLIVLLGLNFYGIYNSYVWMLYDFDGTNFFNGNKRRFELGDPAVVGQTEAICFRDINKGYITNEKLLTVPPTLREFNLNPYLEPPPAPVITSSVINIIQYLSACSDSGSTSFTITNTTTSGGQNLFFTFSGFPAWIFATPVTDTLIPGDSTVITFGFTSGTMNPGVYTANVSIQSNDPLQPIQIVTCTLNVDSNICVGVNELLIETGFHIYPNPFTHSTSIDYTLKHSAKVRLEVFNILGESITLIADSYMQPGNYSIPFPEQTPGIYFIKFSVNEKTVVRKIVRAN